MTDQENFAGAEKLNTKRRYFSEIIKEFTTKYEIRSIYTYVIQSYKIQVITVGTIREDNTNMIYKKCNKCDIKEYITTQFDMNMSMSMYDGKNHKLHGLLDVYNRHLVFPEYFKQIGRAHV